MEKAITYLYKKDAIFEQIRQQYGIPIQPKRPQGFHTLVLLIFVISNLEPQELYMNNQYYQNYPNQYNPNQYNQNNNVK